MVFLRLFTVAYGGMKSKKISSTNIVSNLCRKCKTPTASVNKLSLFHYAVFDLDAIQLFQHGFCSDQQEDHRRCGMDQIHTTNKVYAHAIQNATAASAEMMDNLLKPIKKQA